MDFLNTKPSLVLNLNEFENKIYHPDTLYANLDSWSTKRINNPYELFCVIANNWYYKKFIKIHFANHQEEEHFLKLKREMNDELSLIWQEMFDDDRKVFEKIFNSYPQI